MLFYRLRPKALLKLKGYKPQEERKHFISHSHRSGAVMNRSPQVRSITSSDTKFWFRFDLDDSNQSGDESDVSSVWLEDLQPPKLRMSSWRKEEIKLNFNTSHDHQILTASQLKDLEIKTCSSYESVDEETMVGPPPVAPPNVSKSMPTKKRDLKAIWKM